MRFKDCIWSDRTCIRNTNIWKLHNLASRIQTENSRAFWIKSWPSVSLKDLFWCWGSQSRSLYGHCFTTLVPDILVFYCLLLIKVASRIWRSCIRKMDRFQVFLSKMHILSIHNMTSGIHIKVTSSPNCVKKRYVEYKRNLSLMCTQHTLNKSCIQNMTLINFENAHPNFARNWRPVYTRHGIWNLNKKHSWSFSDHQWHPKFVERASRTCTRVNVYIFLTFKDRNEKLNGSMFDA